MKMYKPIRERYPIVAILLALLSLPIAVQMAQTVQVDPGCVISESGDLAELIRAISDQMPGSGSDGMIVPTQAQMSAWETVIAALIDGDLVTACNAIKTDSFPYQIVRFTDTSADGNKSYLILRENLPISVGWGTYVIKAGGQFRDVVIEIPHPRSDLQTDEQGVDIFSQINARALLMAGTRRLANSSYSPCDGTTAVSGTREPFRESDVSHATQTMFQVSHRVLVPCGGKTVAMQLHGHRRSTCPDLFIGNTTCTPGELTNQVYVNAVTECKGAEFSIDVADCVEPECPLFGSTNVQGRFSNGCSTPSYDACDMAVSSPSSPEQFIYIEQSFAFRQDYDCLIAAIKATFPDRVNFRRVLEEFLTVLNNWAKFWQPAHTNQPG